MILLNILYNIFQTRSEFMKHGWLIYNQKDAKENQAYIDWFMKEADLQQLHLKFVYQEDITIGIIHNQNTILLKDQQVDIPTFAVVRTIDPILSYHLEACGVRVFNSANTSELCNHKSKTYQAIHKLDIPMVDTIFAQRLQLTDHPPMHFPFVIKESTGRGGQKVFLISNQQDWHMHQDKRSSIDIVIQSARVQHGKDVRVFVIGQTIIGAVLRENPHDFRANFKLGGTATWYPLQTTEQKLVQKIINHFNFDMVGIDFLLDENGNLLFNEIEDVVGSRTLSYVSEINLLQKYVTHIKMNI